MRDDKMRDAERLLGRKQAHQSRDKERRVALLGTMITDFENVIADLDGQIAAEEDRTKIKDSSDPRYSTFAMAATRRRKNLLMSLLHIRSILETESGDLGPNKHNLLPSGPPPGSPPEAISDQRLSQRDP